MAASQSRSQAVRQSLHLRIEPSPYTVSQILITPHTPSYTVNISTEAGDGQPQTGNPESIMFSVLCMFDFVSEDTGMLSFHKNEILDIVKRDDTGWWAAMRKGGSVVGWIPHAYVNRLSPEMTDRLRNIREELRIYEYEAEQLYNSAPVARTLPLFDPDSATPSPIPEGNEADKATSSKWTPTSYHNSREVIQIGGKHNENVNPYATPIESPRPRPIPPPSPTSPLPRPPTRAASTNHRPTPPILSQDTDLTRIRAGSLSSRSLRRRPVMVDDNPTLSRISTLIKSNNTREIDKLASPDIAGSFEAIIKRPRDDKMLRRTGSEDSRQVFNIVHPQRCGPPWYLRPKFADQLDEDNKGHVRSGTLASLIEKLTTDIDATDLTKLAESRTFTGVFLMTFRTFTTANRLFEMLVERFHMKPPNSLTEAEYKDWKINLRIPVQRRVLEVFSVWLEEQRLLEEEPHIAQRLTDFLNLIVSPPHNITALAIMQTIERLTFTIPIRVSATVSSRKARKSKAHKNDLLKLDPVDVAEQLALLEFSLYVKITPQECLTYAKTQTGNAVAKLRDFCGTHDKLGSWVKISVLNNEALGKRADTVDFWIKVAEKCRLLNNFASMSAIIIALSSTVITRLHLTWAHVNRKSNLDALLRYNEPTGGFAGYRNLVQQAEGSCVPFIGMFLTDIVHVQEQFNQEEGRICFYQRARWYETITNMLRFQPRPYSIAVSESTMNFIDGHLREGSGRDQGWFWTKSQEVQQSELAHADIRKGLEAAGF
ncbi:ras guanine nucleotide exchange factor domain-containing protein [Crassisporium funariophilum]|nr:ras guanine nucleotide exchange factor domain-containing protein [Crassisporium funariophilum]